MEPHSQFANFENQSGKTHGVSLTVSGRQFSISPMTGDALENWTTLRFMFHWRQLCVFRKLKSSMVSPTILDENLLNQEKKDDIDQKCSEISKEWLSLGNALIANALVINGESDAELIRSIEVGERYKIISTQDQLNGFNMIHEFEKLEKMQKSAERIAKAMDQAAQNDPRNVEQDLGPSNPPLQKPSKISKKLFKKKNKSKNKSKK